MAEEKERLNALRRVRRMVIRDQNLTIDQIMDRLGEDKPSRFVVATEREHTRAVLHECKALGKLK